MKNSKVKVIVGKFVRFCSGVRSHGWYESNVGLIRKPIQNPDDGKEVKKENSDSKDS